MNSASANDIKKLVNRHGRSRSSLLDIMREIQSTYGYISPLTITQVAEELEIPRIDVQGFVSFYAFLSEERKGRIVIRLSNDLIDQMKGMGRIIEAFSRELEIGVGETTVDGEISLETTPCIGLCDQAPAGLVNEVPITDLSTDKVADIVGELRSHGDPKRLVTQLGDGMNAHELVHSMVRNNIREAGPLIFSDINRGEAIRKAVAMTPHEVIRALKTARLRGRGGAGFPTGVKWEFTRNAPGERKFIICNADEGEPGTFKDRVILTERADRVFAGMTIAGYAIGASEGILYLRGEYEYLRRYLEHLLEERRKDGLLGENVSECEGFNFDIRIQLGAGAYICGEETALISSCEGFRGEPKTRPPFPAQKGFLGCPTAINNVETLCCVTKILENGPATFAEYGVKQSTGTKLLSVSGDCLRPGTYELPFGLSIRDLLTKVGASEAMAVQVGGPSGQLIGPNMFNRIICYDDLATGGSMMVFGPERNLFQIIEAFADFFIHESCGYCTPCRVGNVALKELIHRIGTGRGDREDLEQLKRTATTMKTASRCGLGQTSCNPVLTTMEHFTDIYEALVQNGGVELRRSFSLSEAVVDSERIVGRESVHAR